MPTGFLEVTGPGEIPLPGGVLRILVMSVSRDGAERIGVVVIHGVGSTRPGWINQDVIPHLMRADPALKFESHSEVEELASPKRGTPGSVETAAFSSYLRRAGYGHGSHIVFMELFWADISRVGRGWVSSLFAMLQLFYEAPLVLSAAFMRREQAGLRRVIASIVRIANWLLRWPISGLNIAVFFAILGLAGMHFLEARSAWLAQLAVPDAIYIGLGLALTAMLAIRLADRKDDKNILRSELAPSTAISALVLLAVLVAAYQTAGPAALEGLSKYLLFAAVPLLLLWLVWSHLVVAGIIVLGLVALGWTFLPRSRRQGTPMQPAVALAVTMMQGVIWKIVIALTWFILIRWLEPGSLDLNKCAWTEMSSCRNLGRLSTELVVIVTLNVIMAGLLALTVLGVFLVRSYLVKYRLEAVTARQTTLPRIIVSRPAVFLMFVLTVLNFGLYYGPAYLQAITGAGYAKLAVNLSVVGFAQPLLHQYEGTVSALWAVLVLSLTFLILTSSISPVLHILRDLVNHQYSWQLPGRAWSVRSPWSQFGVRLAGREEEHPRRMRIIERLDTLMHEILSRERCRRLILIGHSQGSVILYDYLRTKWDDQTLASVERIDIITLGSPLGHIYQHYFPDYELRAASAADLNAKLKSWTNLWRADDPIGHEVDVIAGDFIENIPLPPGGHVDYWREEKVCSIILERIAGSRTLHAPLKMTSDLTTALTQAAGQSVK